MAYPPAKETISPTSRIRVSPPPNSLYVSTKLFGSRDRFGIKPLYRFRSADCVLLASEIKSIRASGLYQGSTNWGVAARYLVDALLDDTTETFYTSIEQIAPGITVHMIGGHSKGLQSVRVKTRRGYVVLASDATHLYAHINEGRVGHYQVSMKVGFRMDAE